MAWNRTNTSHLSMIPHIFSMWSTLTSFQQFLVFESLIKYPELYFLSYCSYSEIWTLGLLMHRSICTEGISLLMQRNTRLFVHLAQNCLCQAVALSGREPFYNRVYKYPSDSATSHGYPSAWRCKVENWKQKVFTHPAHIFTKHPLHTHQCSCTSSASAATVIAATTHLFLSSQNHGGILDQRRGW